MLEQADIYFVMNTGIGITYYQFKHLAVGLSSFSPSKIAITRQKSYQFFTGLNLRVVCPTGRVGV
jgi:hypothetical protein